MLEGLKEKKQYLYVVKKNRSKRKCLYALNKKNISPKKLTLNLTNKEK